MGRRKRYHVLKLAKKRRQEALTLNQEAVKASTSDLNNQPMVEPTIEPKIALKVENEAPVEMKHVEAEPVKNKTQKAKATRRKTTTTKKPVVLGAKKKTTTRRRRTTKKVEETNNEQS
tara:strand:+ start:211 stop:564 length:354 start_codon:yes stop_codon:yes gene_type:complete